MFVNVNEMQIVVYNNVNVNYLYLHVNHIHGIYTIYWVYTFDKYI
jgi:hypothetical protein